VSFDDQVLAGWAAADPDDPQTVINHFAALLAAHPGDARALFEMAGAFDWCGRPADAASGYEQAFAAGLDGDERRRALVQYGSTLRNLDRPDEAVAVLRRASMEFPGNPSVRAFLGLALLGAGRAEEAVAELLDLVVDGASSADLLTYEAALRRYAGELRPDGDAHSQSVAVGAAAQVDDAGISRCKTVGSGC
jgi:tetratricopeptide (TPR) repeat protein